MDPQSEVIMVFKNALIKNKTGLRIKNLTGYLASRNRKHLRQWFIRMYPNPADYILFIHENPAHFSYDPMTGIITLNTRTPDKKIGVKRVQKNSSPTGSSGDENMRKNMTVADVPSDSPSSDVLFDLL